MMGAYRQPSQDVFRTDDGHGIGFPCAVESGKKQQASRTHQRCRRLDEGIDISHMFDDLKRQHHVVLFSCGSQRLGGGVAIIDMHPFLLGMQARHLDVLLRRIDTGNLPAQSGQRLADESTAATDIQNAYSRQWAFGRSLLAQRGDTLAYEVQSNGVHLVQRAELSLRIPPGIRHCREMGNLL